MSEPTRSKRAIWWLDFVELLAAGCLGGFVVWAADGPGWAVSAVAWLSYLAVSARQAVERPRTGVLVKVEGQSIDEETRRRITHLVRSRPDGPRS